MEAPTDTVMVTGASLRALSTRKAGAAAVAVATAAASTSARGVVAAAAVAVVGAEASARAASAREAAAAALTVVGVAAVMSPRAAAAMAVTGMGVEPAASRKLSHCLYKAVGLRRNPFSLATLAQSFVFDMRTVDSSTPSNASRSRVSSSDVQRGLVWTGPATSRKLSHCLYKADRLRRNPLSLATLAQSFVFHKRTVDSLTPSNASRSRVSSSGV